MKRILITALTIGAIAAFVGLYLYNKPLDSTASLKTDIRILATELLDAYETDEEKANSLYLDKVIVVNGLVTKTEEKDGKVTVYLDADNDLSNIIFQMEDADSNIKEGQKVSLKGICTGFLMDVVLVRAVQV